MNIWDVADEDREAFVVFQRCSNGGYMTVQGLENMADVPMFLDHNGVTLLHVGHAGLVPNSRFAAIHLVNLRVGIPVPLCGS